MNQVTELLCNPFWLQMRSQMTPFCEEWRRRERAGLQHRDRRPRQALAGPQQAALDVKCDIDLTDMTDFCLSQTFMILSVLSYRDGFSLSSL